MWGIDSLRSSLKTDYYTFNPNTFKNTKFLHFIIEEDWSNLYGCYYIIDNKIEDIPSTHCMIVIIHVFPLVLLCYDSYSIPGNIWLGVAWNYDLGLGWIKLN